MSTQRRVVRWQRNSEQAGTVNPPSIDGGTSGPETPFRRAVDSRTASHSGMSSLRTGGGRDLATNSLSFSSSCIWVQRNSLGCLLLYEVEQHDRFFSGAAENAGWNSFPTASPRASLAFSPPTRRFRADQFMSAPTHAVGLAAVPTGSCRGTERQHGQGNLYFEHAA